MKSETLICGQENFKAFRARLSADFQDCYNLVKALYETGLIQGIRGMRLEIYGEEILEKPERAEKPKKLEMVCHYCVECRQWRADTIGDGTGFGQCLLKIRPRQLKWPNTPACKEFVDGK